MHLVLEVRVGHPTRRASTITQPGRAPHICADMHENCPGVGRDIRPADGGSGAATRSGAQELRRRGAGLEPATPRPPVSPWPFRPERLIFLSTGKGPFTKGFRPLQ